MNAEARPAVAEGERSVAVAGSPRNTLIITGDRNTVQMRLQGIGAVLAFAFRWDRPRRRRRRDRRPCPPRFEDHVDRQDEVLALVGAHGSPRVANLYGESGVGKTRVLIEALNRRESRMRHGAVYLDGRELAAADLLHAIFDELYEVRVQRRDLRIERRLASRKALVVLEDVDVSADDAQRLVLGAPRCRFLLSSSQRVLFDGTPLKLGGLGREHAAAIAELELGRPLGERERHAADLIAEALGGNPLRMRQTFGRARDEGRGRPLDELAASLLPAQADQRLGALTPQQREVARALAVHHPGPVGLEHLRQLAGDDAAAVAEELDARHDAESHSPRYSLTGPLAEALAGDALDAETERALAYFTEWAESGPDREAVRTEAVALLALLERAAAAGRSAEVIRLGRAIESSYAWGHRWAAWGKVLELVLAAARKCDDRSAEGWALHQLGTRAYGLGRPDEASALLRQALKVRERIGDRDGAGATRANLRVVSGRAPLLYRLSHISLAVVAITALLLIGAGGAAGAGVFGGGDHETQLVRLVVALGGDGDGSVISDRGGIRCGSRCEAELPVGTEVVVRPSPVLGSQFTRWRGRGPCSGTAPCRLRLASDVRVTAVFSKVREPRELAVKLHGRGTVVSRPAGIRCPGVCRVTLQRGRPARLTATAGSGYRFAGWSGDCHGTLTCHVRLERSRSVGARFVAASGTATLDIDKRGDGDGSVLSDRGGIDCGGTCSASLRSGSTVVLTAHASRKSIFRGWSGAGCHGTAPCEITLERHEQVLARFALRSPPVGTVTLSIDPSGEGAGTVTSDLAGIDCGETCSAAFKDGAEVVLTAMAERGSEFAGWSGGGCSGTRTCTVILTSALTVTATFDAVTLPKKRFTLTTKTFGQASGEISPNCAHGCPYDEGSSVTLTATPTAEGSSFMAWSGACSANKSNTCTITMTDDLDVTARFEYVQG